MNITAEAIAVKILIFQLHKTTHATITDFSSCSNLNLLEYEFNMNNRLTPRKVIAISFYDLISFNLLCNWYHGNICHEEMIDSESASPVVVLLTFFLSLKHMIIIQCWWQVRMLVTSQDVGDKSDLLRCWWQNVDDRFVMLKT